MEWTGILLGFGAAVVFGLPAAIFEIKRQTRRARAAERRARDAERLAEIGAMTGGLAHEIKNPLSTIGLNAQLLGEGVADLPVDPGEKGRLIRRVEALRREVERLRDILQDFLRFAGSVRIEPRETDLNVIAEELIDFFSPQARQIGATLRADLSPGGVRASIDPGHFKQAVLNLLINATQAIEEEARADSPSPSDPRAPIAAAGKEIIVRTAKGKNRYGPTAMLSVIDTGPGIPRDRLESIWTPYFTTKAGGSGLGLPTTRRLIEEHSGTIEVHSEPGRGTEFTIVVPRK